MERRNENNHVVFDNEKLKDLDKNINNFLSDFNLTLKNYKIKSIDPSEFIFFKEPNILFLHQTEVKDKVNYVKSIQYFLNYLNETIELFKEEKLIFIYMMEFPVHYIMLYLLQLSYEYNIEIYFLQEDIDEYNLKDLEDLESEDLENLDKLNNKPRSGSLKIFNFEKAIENNYLKKD